MHDVYHQTVPSNLRSMFRLTTDVHNYRTRSASNQHYYRKSYIKPPGGLIIFKHFWGGGLLTFLLWKGGLIREGGLIEDLQYDRCIWNKSYMNCGNENQFTQLRKRPEKNSGLQRGLNPWPAIKTRWSPEFFSGFSRNCINCVHNCSAETNFCVISRIFFQRRRNFALILRPKPSTINTIFCWVYEI